MKSIKIIFVISLFLYTAACFSAGKIYQVSTIGALTAGVFDGNIAYSKIEKHGDFGLGTFKGLNGEMVALNGHYYRMDPKGNLTPFDKKLLSPFAEVTYFKSDESYEVKNIHSYSALTKVLLKNIKNKNFPYAIKITGQFDHVFMRSLLNYKKPYPTLVVATKEQTEFTLNHTEGTLVGFWFPNYWGVIAVNGLHLHFVNKSRSKGGHVLNMKIKQAKIEIMPINNIEIKLPNTKTFSKKDFDNQAIHKQIEEAEGSTK